MRKNKIPIWNLEHEAQNFTDFIKICDYFLK